MLLRRNNIEESIGKYIVVERRASIAWDGKREEGRLGRMVGFVRQQAIRDDGCRGSAHGNNGAFK